MRNHWLTQGAKAAAPGIAAGLLYGLVLQAVGRAEKDTGDTMVLMTIGYIFLLPLVVGALTVVLAPPDSRKSWAYRILMPWLTSSLCMAVAFAFQWEGSICLILGMPIYLTLSSIGGILAGIVLTAARDNRMRAGFALLLMVVPPAAGRIEVTQPLPAEEIETATFIDISASPAIVWRNIIRVPAITEEQSGFFYKIGFPKPVEATLSREGIGGVRQASFERGLLFAETVHEWEPLRALAFRIEVDPDSTPATTLDEHVTVGGHYFDVLDGKYEIESLGSNHVRLHLKSRHRLSTRFNWYAGLWSSFLMQDIQKSILRVIKLRCENAAAS